MINLIMIDLRLRLVVHGFVEYHVKRPARWLFGFESISDGKVGAEIDQMHL